MRFEGRQCQAGDYAGHIVDGFRQMYRFLMAGSAALLAPGGPLTAMIQLPVRCIYRPTKTYGAVANTCLVPQFLRDGMDTSIQADVLCRPLLGTDEKHPFWRVLAAEPAALLRADIPLFRANAGSTALILESGQPIADCFDEPGFERMKQRFRKLSADDLDRQVSYTRSCLHRGAAQAPTAAPEAEALPREELVAEAVSIAHQIEREAIRSDDGGATWVTIAYHADAQRWQLEPMTPRLFDGVCGTALFLAAVEAVTGGAGFRPLALGAFRTADASLERAATIRALFDPGIGAGLGGSSLLYGCALGTVLLDEESLLDDACRVARLLTPRRIKEDRHFDLLSGGAGALVALRALYRMRPEAWLLESAVACGSACWSIAARVRSSGERGRRQAPALRREPPGSPMRWTGCGRLQIAMPSAMRRTRLRRPGVTAHPAAAVWMISVAARWGVRTCCSQPNANSAGQIGSGPRGGWVRRRAEGASGRPV